MQVDICEVERGRLQDMYDSTRQPAEPAPTWPKPLPCCFRYVGVQSTMLILGSCSDSETRAACYPSWPQELDANPNRIALARSLDAGGTRPVAPGRTLLVSPSPAILVRNQEVQRGLTREIRHFLRFRSGTSSGNENPRVYISPSLSIRYWKSLEARVGIEPTNKGFADLFVG